MSQTNQTLGGTFQFPGTAHTVHRMGYGAMQLAGPGVWGPPRDRQEAIAVLREAIESGVDHIDTSDFYGPHTVNQLILEALHLYPCNLTLVTKVGAKRGADKSWLPAVTREDLVSAVDDNLRHLGVDALHIVNFRAMPGATSIEEQFAVLAELQQQGKIEHLGVSSVTPALFEQAQRIAPVVCVQNLYNVAHREDDAFLDALAAQGIAYVPYFPLGGFNPLQSSELEQIAQSLGATPMQTALAWLLHRSPNILLIPGTSSRSHLRENLAAAALELTPAALEQLDELGSAMEWHPPHG